MKKNKVKIIGGIIMIIGLLLVAAALSLALYNIWDSRRAGEASQVVLEVIEQEIAEKTQEKPSEIIHFLPADINEEELTIHKMKTTEIDGELYIGFIEIPALDIKLPVMYDWSYPQLEIAPCAFAGSYYTNNLVIAGHNYGSHFSPLKWIEVNTDVYFTTVDGEVIHYLVDYVETLKPTAIENLTDSKGWDLTMFTCTTGGQSRCVVRCVKV